MLRLPDGLETVGDGWFTGCIIEKLIVPSSVKMFRQRAFSYCVKLREIVFEPGSQLEVI